jgi:FkbM family methyltransferase
MNVRAGLVAIIDRMPSRVARHLHGQAPFVRLLRPVVNRMMPTGIVEVRVRSGLAEGLLISIEPRQEKYYWTGTYEPNVQNAMAAVLRRGDVMWDVGAHAGFHTALASRLVGPDGEVVAFEPFPPNVARLERLVSANRLDNVRIRPIAVSGGAGRALFHVTSSTSMGSLAPIAAATADIEVSTTTLDRELATLRPPVLVKIDVEGAEASVLAGATRLLSEVMPRLLIELLSPDAVDRAREVLPSYEFTRLDVTNYLGEPTR